MSTIGGIEAGGITFVLSTADISEPTKPIEKAVIPTGNPEETLKKVAEWFNGKNVSAIGIATFGPLDIDPKSKTYGYITTTPKKNWQGVDFLGYLRKHLDNGANLPIGFQTDVNAAARAENQTPRHSQKSSCVYITVGGGIGVGISYRGEPFVGMSHGEGGHLRTAKYHKDASGPPDSFAGVCPFHGDCVEGLSSAPAIARRLGVDEKDLAGVEDSNAVWDVVAFYLGELCAAITLMLCPEVIVIGGGVLKRGALLPKIRARCLESLGGYISLKGVVDRTEEFIVPAFYDDNSAGVVGSLVLAVDALSTKN